MKKRYMFLFAWFLIYLFILNNFVFNIPSKKIVSSSFFISEDLLYKNYLDDSNTTFNVGNFLGNDTLSNSDEESIKNFLNQTYFIRNKAFLNGNIENLQSFFDKDKTFSNYSLNYELKRIYYLRNFAKEKGITFKNISSSINIRDLKFKDNMYTLVLDEECKFDYFYDSNKSKVNSFGVKLNHYIELESNSSSFIILKDYYKDFITNIPEVNISLDDKSILVSSNKSKSNLDFNINRKNTSNTFDRNSASKYANKYSGISFASNYRYNKNYYIYTGGEGNSVNFISQAISDKYEGGKLSQDNLWFYKLSNNKKIEVSSTWVKSSEFIAYLLKSNKATISYNGSINEMNTVMKSSNKNINIGDIIALYNVNGDISRLGIVTDFDNSNYPLINCNSIDTYKIPFDLGFNDNSKITILSIN